MWPPRGSVTFQVPITTPARELAQADVTSDLQRREDGRRVPSTSAAQHSISAPFTSLPMKRHSPNKPLFLPTPTLGCVSVYACCMYVCICTHVCAGVPVHLLGSQRRMLGDLPP